MKIPEKLYHATTRKNALSIMNTGLKPLSIGHLIYFADSFGGASMFSYLHGIPLEDIIVVIIDTTNLNKDLFDYGYDHSPTFFKNIEVYTYSEEISIEHIYDYMRIDIENMKGELL